MARHKQFWVSPPAKVRPHPPPCPSSEIKKNPIYATGENPEEYRRKLFFDCECQLKMLLLPLK